MTDEVRRKKKGAKKKSSEAGDSTFVLAIVAAVVVVGIVVVVAVVSINRPRQDASLATAQNPLTASGGTTAAASDLTGGRPNSATSTGNSTIGSTNGAEAVEVHIPVISADAKPLQDTLSTGARGQFDIRLPVGWKSENGALFMAEPDIRKLAQSPESVRGPSIRIIPAPTEKTTLKQHTDAAVAAARQAGTQILDDRPAKIAGYEARRLIFGSQVKPEMAQSWKLPPDEQTRNVQYFVGPVNNIILIVAMSAHNDDGRFDKMLPTFEAVVSTLRIPAEAGPTQ